MSATNVNCNTSVERPFTAKRIMVPGKIMRPSPSVVRCEWKNLKTEHLLTHEPSLEEIQDPNVCREHVGCLGHLAYDQETDAFLMPCGFARGNEDMFGDMFQMNKAILLGEMEKTQIASKCYSKLATKHGILRKQNNGTRPTNSFRLVASPSIAIRFGTMEPHTLVDDGWVEVPKRVLEKARFMRMSDTSLCYLSKMQIGEVIVIGRCPSQGPDSTIPLKVREAPEGVNSIGIPLQLCTLTNADFDGDEVWGYVPMTKEGSREAEQRWTEIWERDPPKPIFRDVYKVAVENEISPLVDPAILTTMTFDEMSEHEGGPMYESMLLKPKSWKTMHSVMTSKDYWKTTVSRSEHGMFNTAMGRHGLSVPYGYMRAGMMMGTVVDMHKNKVVVNSSKAPQIPVLKQNPQMQRTTCCLALTKMTRAVYQMGIDRQKHGNQSDRVPAICTILGDFGVTYGVLKNKRTYEIVLDQADNLSGNTKLFSRLECIRTEPTYNAKLRKAYQISALIEEIDNVNLTVSERLSVAYFFVYLSDHIDNLMYNFSVNIYALKELGLDWYTSLTCSDIRWLKNIMRTREQRRGLVMHTDTSTVLGTIFLGDLSLS